MISNFDQLMNQSCKVNYFSRNKIYPFVPTYVNGFGYDEQTT